MRPPLAVLWLAACGPAPGGGATDGGATDGGVTDAGGDAGGMDTGPFDVDGDGSVAAVDCDDADAAVFPGADEVAWNGVDDDCDGVADGDGAYTGALAVSASAVFEGERHSFDRSCPASLSRSGDAVDFVITCTQDVEDEWQMLLLGETLTFVPRDAPVSATAGAWAGRSEVESSNGWDTLAEAALSWTGLDSVGIMLSLDAASLGLSGAGMVTRQEAAPCPQPRTTAASESP